MTKEYLQAVDLTKAYRLFNLGATCLVSAAHDGKVGVMPATWNCPLDVYPFRATVVIDKSHFTRPLMDNSEYFALQLPSVGIARETLFLGTNSQCDMPDKLVRSGARFFNIEGFSMPFVDGCVAWAVFKKLPEFAMTKTYDLFLGECVAAFADSRIYVNNHWEFENADASLRTFHYVAGGHYLAIGESFDLKEFDGLA